MSGSGVQTKNRRVGFLLLLGIVVLAVFSVAVAVLK